MCYAVEPKLKEEQQFFLGVCLAQVKGLITLSQKRQADQRGVISSRTLSSIRNFVKGKQEMFFNALGSFINNGTDLNDTDDQEEKCLQTMHEIELGLFKLVFNLCY